MKSNVSRKTVDLSSYQNLVVIYLGMRVNVLEGAMTLLGFKSKIAKSVESKPKGLLLHEDIVYSFFPPHVGMRQYWESFEMLEAWSKSEPHREWWKEFMKNSGGTGFWHEAYFMKGGMEAIYSNISEEIGFLKFAPQLEATGSMNSARERKRHTDTSILTKQNVKNTDTKVEVVSD